MPIETMTPKERWLAVLNRQQPDRVPMDYWATPEVTRKLMRHFGCSTSRQMLKKLRVDFVVTLSPRYIGPPLPKNVDVYGIHYRDVSYGTGKYTEAFTHPLAGFTTVDEIQKNFRFPNPDWWDYRGIPYQLRGVEEYPIRGGGSEPFLLYKKLRGDEQAMVDLVEHPEIVEYCLEQLFELAYQNTLRIYERVPGKVNLTYVAEDMGGQHDLMISPRHIRRFLLPGMKRIMDLAHQAGAYVFHHNDGNVIRILPDMIDLGIDILNPIQWRSDHMDRGELKRRFGDKVIFHGAVDNQYTLPFGTPNDVRQEVLDNLRILGEGGGYIIAPCHNLQPITPIANILALYETGYEAGWK